MKPPKQELEMEELYEKISYLINDIADEKWLARCAFVSSSAGPVPVCLVSFPEARWGEVKDALEEIFGKPVSEIRVQ